MDKNASILVVDDDKEIADLVEIYLVNDGYKVLKASDGDAVPFHARRASGDPDADPGYHDAGHRWSGGMPDDSKDEQYPDPDPLCQGGGYG